MSEAAVKEAESFEGPAEGNPPRTATIHYLEGAQPPNATIVTSVPPKTGLSRHTHADNHPLQQQQQEQKALGPAIRYYGG